MSTQGSTPNAHRFDPVEATIRGREVHLEPSPRWVRVRFGGKTIVDSKHVLLLIESGRLPTYFFPLADIDPACLEPADKAARAPAIGRLLYWDIRVEGSTAEAAAYGPADPPAELERLKDHLTVKWSLMDELLEEDEPVYVHPRNPYTRVDVVPSSRRVRIELDGVTVAASDHPWLLFETGLPTRYYFKKEDVRMDLLTPTDTHTRCPYKGEASYWSVTANETTHPDLAWGYPDPIPECPKLKGLLAFYNEKVDTFVDGVLEERPQTPWS